MAPGRVGGNADARCLAASRTPRRTTRSTDGGRTKPAHRHTPRRYCRSQAIEPGGSTEPERDALEPRVTRNNLSTLVTDSRERDRGRRRTTILTSICHSNHTTVRHTLSCCDIVSCPIYTNSPNSPTPPNALVAPKRPYSPILPNRLLAGPDRSARSCRGCRCTRTRSRP